MTKFEWADPDHINVVVTEQGDFWCPVGTHIANGDKLPAGVIPSPEWKWVEQWVKDGGGIQPFGADPELAKQRAIRDLVATDAGMARVVEDFLVALKAKGRMADILSTDLPPAVWSKLDDRTVLRAKMAAGK